MSPVAIAFWGAFFGSGVLVLGGSFLLLLRSLKRAAAIGAFSAAVPILYALVFLGWVAPSDRDAHDRLLAHVTVVSGIALSMMLLYLLGWLRRKRSAARSFTVMCAVGLPVLVAGWLTSPLTSLLLACAFTIALCLAMLVAGIRYARAGRRMAGSAVLGVLCILVGAVCLEATALLRGAVPWPVHALAASCGVVYMAIMGSALWQRVSYAVELREVMALGPTYDTVTRMPAHSEAGKVVGALLRKAGPGHRIGVIAVSIANIRLLESLHGRAAQNHALFVCATRLRSGVPLGAELCRLGDDGFLVVIRSPDDVQQMRQVARNVRRRMMRPVGLSTSVEIEPGDAHTEWQPEIGVGIAVSDERMTPGNAVATARAASRTALAYSSRMGFCDSMSAKVTEVPLESGDSVGH